MRYQNLIPPTKEEILAAIRDEAEKAAVELTDETVRIEETLSGLQVVRSADEQPTGHYL